MRRGCGYGGRLTGDGACGRLLGCGVSGSHFGESGPTHLVAGDQGIDHFEQEALNHGEGLRAAARIVAAELAGVDGEVEDVDLAGLGGGQRSEQALLEEVEVSLLAASRGGAAHGGEVAAGILPFGQVDYGALGIVLDEGGDVLAIRAAGRAPGLDTGHFERGGLGAGVLPITVDLQPGAGGGLEEVRVEVAAAPVTHLLHAAGLLDQGDLFFHHGAPGFNGQAFGVFAEVGVFVKVQSDLVTVLRQAGEHVAAVIDGGPGERSLGLDGEFAAVTLDDAGDGLDILDAALEGLRLVVAGFGPVRGGLVGELVCRTAGQGRYSRSERLDVHADAEEQDGRGRGGCCRSR